MDPCPICQEELNVKESGKVTLTCNHSFHFSCIGTWISTQASSDMHASCPYCRKEMHEKEVFVPPPAEEETTLLREPDYVSFNCSEMNNFFNKYFQPGVWYVPMVQWNSMFTSGLYKTYSTYQGEQRILFNRTELDILLLHKCWDTLDDDIWNDLPKDGDDTISGAFESARLDFSSPLYLPYTTTTFTAHTWEIPNPLYEAEPEFEPVRTTWHLVDGGLISPYLLQDEEPLVTFECDAMTFRQAETFASAAVNKIKALWANYRERKRAKISDRVHKQIKAYIDRYYSSYNTEHFTSINS